MINVTLPDGSVRDYQDGASPAGPQSCQHWKAGLGALLTLVLGACTITLDEARVFQPQPRDDNWIDGGRNGLEFLEDIFTRPGDITIESNVNGEKLSIYQSKADFVRARVTHGVIDTVAGSIAYTLIEKKQADLPLFVHCGGNAADRYNSGADYALKVVPYGNVLLFDYPGYGDSPGKPGITSFEAMTAALGDFATDQSGSNPLIFWGHSLGGFVCARLARETTAADGLIVEASARTGADVADAWAPWYARPFVRFRIAESLAEYDTAASAADFGKPVLILGGKRDRTLPVSLSRKLVEGAVELGADVTYLELPGANHFTIAQQPDFPSAMAAYLATLNHQSDQTIRDEP